MSERQFGERVSVMETRLDHFEEKMDEFQQIRNTRAAREWAVILAGLGLVGTVLAKNLGFM